MQDWRQWLVSCDSEIRRAVEIIDSAPSQRAFIVDERDLLIGTVSDTELRTAILHGIKFDDAIRSLIELGCVAPCGDQRVQIATDAGGRLMSILMSDNIPLQQRDNIAVLMAGGPGQRLRPLTETCPKPLLKVRGKPLLETTLENLHAAGFKRVFLAVNYLSQMVKNYFGNGENWGLEIHYLEEKQRLGTAGALSLLPPLPDQPLLVMNGDVVTKLNFAQLLSYHAQLQTCATMCVRMYDYKIPYGVVQVSGSRIKAMQEKPTHSFFVNAGIYVLNRSVLSKLEKEQYLDMPTLFENLQSAGESTSAFPIREQWIDIGDVAEYERAQQECPEQFVPTVSATATILS